MHLFRNIGHSIWISKMWQLSHFWSVFRMSLSASVLSVTVKLMSSCSATAWFFRPPSGAWRPAGPPRFIASVRAFPSSSWALRATCGRTSRCWSDSRTARRNWWVETTLACAPGASAPSRLLNAPRWRRRTWRRCSTAPSWPACGTRRRRRGRGCLRWEKRLQIKSSSSQKHGGGNWAASRALTFSDGESSLSSFRSQYKQTLLKSSPDEQTFYCDAFPN